MSAGSRLGSSGSCTPSRVGESTLATAVDDWFPQRRHSYVRRWENHTSGRYEGGQYGRDLAAYTMLKRMHSNRPVLETMVDFWSDHFHVKATGDISWVYRDDYDRTVRAYALGRFDRLLEAVTLQPGHAGLPRQLPIRA